MFKFTDHMENCISTVCRMLRLLNILKGIEIGASFPRVVRKHIDSLTIQVVDIRNLIEHIEKEIQNDAIGEEEPIMLKLAESQEGVVIGSQYLRFSALSILIKRLHELGQAMVAWRGAEEKYYLRRLQQLELVEEKIGHWIFILLALFVPMMFLVYKVAREFTGFRHSSGI